MRLITFISTLLIGLPQAFALMPVTLQAAKSADQIKEICLNPNTTDDERSEIISRSLQDAVACMGENWVYGDPEKISVAEGGMAVDINVSERRMRFIDPTGKSQVWLISPGTAIHPTHLGDFQGPYRVEDGNYVVQSKDVDYTGAPMPWAVFYFQGYAIHGTYAVGQLGSPASHGCVRIAKENARLFNSWVRANNTAAVTLHIYKSGPEVDAPPVARQQRRAPPPVQPPEYSAQPWGYNQPYQQPYQQNQQYQSYKRGW